MSQKTIFIAGLVIGVILFVIALNCPGCALVEQVGNALFKSSKPDSNIVPVTSKGQLWLTIKGLTPNWLAIPVIALGAVAVFNGAAKLGMSFIIFGCVNLFMALATSRFGFWMAAMGLIGSIAAVLASMFAKSKALRDIIGNLQTIKETAKDDNVDLVFQDKMKEVLANQVKSTKKVVAKVKSKMRAR